ncbi:malonyl-ACP O-methyltransferase BioC [Kushneria phyllosphaerae]|uniref:Malonyl-[acyl-carrier protein] O-methyltransferase n=1 Tax=Kushneria phyllosphaerae TaxID=2100822 RepID=A0A2R8CH37_9GAMM|nr:malonyl-ACP O-methyltransferase BioC [Kushneria phyllosphaerae]SPJ32132.1 Malonyl-[acyl-carrier protein] O-methyltransferase [Kushneria phyllosphaerae]
MSTEATLALKHRIATSFSRAAPHYDHHAGLQREVADDLLRALPTRAMPQRLADVGCGTGYVTRGLRARYPEATITGIDPAPGMLEEAARRHGHGRLYWQSGEAEQLPFADECLDMVVSSLAIQWCATPEGFLREAERTLRPGGWLAFTTLLEGTLDELKTAFKSLEFGPQGNTFLTFEALNQYLNPGRLTTHSLSVSDHRVFHDSAAASLRALKAVGAATPDKTVRHGLMSRRHWAGVAQSLERFRTSKGLPTTYRVAQVLMQKPDELSHDRLPL